MYTYRCFHNFPNVFDAVYSWGRAFLLSVVLENIHKRETQSVHQNMNINNHRQGLAFCRGRASKNLELSVIFSLQDTQLKLWAATVNIGSKEPITVMSTYLHRTTANSISPQRGNLQPAPPVERDTGVRQGCGSGTASHTSVGQCVAVGRGQFVDSCADRYFLIYTGCYRCLTASVV